MSMVMDATSDYSQLAGQLAELAEAAQAGDVERIVALQAAHEKLLARLRANDTDLTRRPDAPKIASLISAALKSIQLATPHLEALRDKAQDDAAGTRMHRKVSQSYR